MNRKIPKDLTWNVAQRDKEMKNMKEKERNMMRDREGLSHSELESHKKKNNYQTIKSKNFSTVDKKYKPSDLGIEWILS